MSGFPVHCQLDIDAFLPCTLTLPGSFTLENVETRKSTKPIELLLACLDTRFMETGSSFFPGGGRQS